MIGHDPSFHRDSCPLWGHLARVSVMVALRQKQASRTGHHIWPSDSRPAFTGPYQVFLPFFSAFDYAHRVFFFFFGLRPVDRVARVEGMLGTSQRAPGPWLCGVSRILQQPRRGAGRDAQSTPGETKA